MNVSPFVLLLDDDPYHLEQLRAYLVQYDFVPLPCTTVEEAVSALAKGPTLAIVDLFLLGESGAELSNGFIKDYLIPRGIPYGRMTSAPRLVPPEYQGSWVFDKRRFYEDPFELYPLLLTMGG